jgi:hypothetical protein
MAREALFIDEIRQSSRPTFEYIITTYADVIMDVFITELRQCLSHHPVFTYIAREDNSGPDYDLTQIIVVDKYTEEAAFFPIITATFNGGNVKWLQFSHSPFNTVLKPQMNLDGSIKRDQQGRFLPSHFEYTGAHESSITFNISTTSTIDREELTSLLQILLAEQLRDALTLQGIFIKDTSVGSQTETPYREDSIFQVTVTANLYSEWKRVVPVGKTLESIGYKMTVGEGIEATPPKEPDEIVPFKLYNLDNEYYVVDENTEQPEIPCFQLSAMNQEPPITLIYNTTMNKWIVSDFWIQTLEETLIPYENFSIELTKNSTTNSYLQYAADAIQRAEVIRALSLSQGRTLPDGTKVLKGNFVYEDGRVEIREATSEKSTKIFAVTVSADNAEVTMKLVSTNKNRNVLIAKNVVFNSDGEVTGGQMFKRIVKNGSELDISLSTLDQVFLDGENFNTMSAVDLFMIMQFADQPFKYTLAYILDKIDLLLQELGNMSLVISNRSGKIANITYIKQELIRRSEKYLLQRPLGL